MDAAARPGIRLSIVIAAWNGPAALEQCLLSLGTDAPSENTEVIAVRNFHGPAAAALESRFPGVRHVPMPAGTTVPVLRTTGLNHSQGEIVALAEDHCTFGQNWCSEVKKAHESTHAVIGGPVENGSVESALDWAVYFYDYGKYATPKELTAIDTLPGNNAWYKRTVLAETAHSFGNGFFEPFAHGEMKRRGYTLHLASTGAVFHRKKYTLTGAAADCYHLARGYAAIREAGAPPLKRLIFAFGSLALPMLLPVRITIRSARRRRHLPYLLRSLPLICLLMTAWAFGEFVGYTAGEGPSGSKWG
jgi:hypothetical protein